MILNGNNYKERILTAEQNLILFKNSVEKCNIPDMIDNSAQFLETIKNADNLYFRFTPKIKEYEKSTNRKSHTLIEQYFNIKSLIGQFCDCKIK